MNELIADAVTEPRFYVYLISAFALVAVAMAAAGTYSVISLLVSQRTGEIAIRIALGARRSHIVKTVIGTTGLWLAVGLTVGLGLGLATNTTVRTLTNAEAVASPAMYTTVVMFFVAVTLAAAYLPVRRAGRIDPATALRRE